MSDAGMVNRSRDRSWLILGLIGPAPLMMVLDITVMNIALPSAQRALSFTTANRQWAVTAYTLAFGSLLTGTSPTRSCSSAGPRISDLVIWFGWQLGAPVKRSLIAYDH